MDKFDMYFDVNSVNILIKKLELYFDNERALISNINNCLLNISDNYLGDNKKIFDSKINYLKTSLDDVTKNKNLYLNTLNKILIGYIDTDKEIRDLYK